MFLLTDRICFSVLLFFCFFFDTKKANGFVSSSGNRVFDSDLLGIGFDPLSFWTHEYLTKYVRYSDFGTMLEVITTRFRRISTYRNHLKDMVYKTGERILYRDPETTAEWLGLEAANWNKHKGTALLQVYIDLGKFENSNETIGVLQSVLPAVKAANARFPGTICGIILHSFSKLHRPVKFRKVLESVVRAKTLTAETEIKIGIRLEASQCNQIGFTKLADELDFVNCFFVTDSSLDEKTAATSAIQNLTSLKAGLPAPLKLQFTGEVAWCSEFENSSVAFYSEVGKLAIRHNLRVDFFEAFDHPRKEFPSMGWWWRETYLRCGWWWRKTFKSFLAVEHFVEKMADVIGPTEWRLNETMKNVLTTKILNHYHDEPKLPNLDENSYARTGQTVLPILTAFNFSISEANENITEPNTSVDTEKSRIVPNETNFTERGSFQKKEDNHSNQVIDQPNMVFNLPIQTLKEFEPETVFKGSESNIEYEPTYFSNEILVIFLAILAITGILILALVATILARRGRKAKCEVVNETTFPLPVIKPLIPMEILSTNIQINTSQMLGAGEYGMVFKGTVTGLHGEFAVKVANFGSVKNLLIEMKILNKIGQHCNVVSMIASSTENVLQGEAMLVLDLCEKGNLSEVLREMRLTIGNRNLSRKTFGKLIQWSLEIALGMEHISSLNVVHGDLAARNILLTYNDVAKITDFGFSRHLYDMKTYLKKTKEPLPIRWMALESLKSGIFSRGSDIWSYGVTLWEMFSFSSSPYKEIPLSVADMIHHLEKGIRLQKPELATEELFDIMTGCWHRDPEERSTFQAIVEELKYLEMGLHDYTNMNAN